ncbi:2-C-methyl-D-erythritol 4-phosphate cytidylyltransferase [Acinetobacter sp. NCu2D-2]|uniref:2-C-methyl-D-erythritol 4-phosphate cytidylyltransferase n=1 Tax=Acinetobacter sp. NCu2D-2 TaxID=1608473 RepID=UPI0007CDC43D|nr:2-C-methyl-D-erythritol 4-phosphate cytidylyltransferase [Acinetobacter sp. NCu2D-2]ANF82679.1 2-C-methyl-D-erythritol 4-phosphate cytidylyltransferase [Acinetobacter sp. NCu2D-2]
MMPNNVRNIAIILASGSGTRFRSETPKQFLKLAGKRVIEHTLDCFQNHAGIDEIIIVTSREQIALMEEIILHGDYSKVTRVLLGGDTRQASSAAGIAAIKGDNHKVLVHDAVRPLLDAATIDRCLNALEHFDAVDTGVPSPDTVIQVDAENCITKIPDREQLRLGQTPQAFRAGLLRKAHALAATDSELKVTDDCGLILHYGLGKVHVVAGDTSNIKITYPSDVYLADRLFQLRSGTFQADENLSALQNKVVVVLGASKGIGQAVQQLAELHGAHIVAASRSSGMDVANSQAVRHLFTSAMEQFGRIDYVVNTAGVLHTGLLAGQSDEVIDEQLLTNLRGSIVVAREAFEVLKEQGGSIALFASSSYTRGRARSAVYSATKAAVVNLMQGLAEEYLPFNVRINAINPERTATPMRTENFGNEPHDSLLDAKTVAGATLRVLLTERTGQVIDVRR